MGLSELLRAFLTLRVTMEYGLFGPTVKLALMGGDGGVVVYNGCVGHLQLLV